MRKRFQLFSVPVMKKILLTLLMAMVAATVSAQTTDDMKALVFCPDSNHPHVVDLKLPSGTKWACCNVGAKSPEGYGGYYSWGETEEKSDYRPSEYKYSSMDDSNGSWWNENGHNYQCKDIGTHISGTDYDVAHVKWGDSWQMPSFAQFRELLENCSSKWTSVNGVEGMLFTSLNNLESIFFPASGNHFKTDLLNLDSEGYYWTDMGYHDGYCAYGLYFMKGYYSLARNFHRGVGFPVRPVVPKAQE